MTIANLIPETVAKLTDPDLYWDDTLKGFGLNVRLDAGGKIRRSWIIQYRIGKQQRKFRIGDAIKLTAKQARKEAEKLFAQIELGQDPQGEKQAKREADQGPPALTLRDALEKYVEMKEAEVREGTYPENSLTITKLYLLRLQYFGPIHKVDINEVTTQAVAARFHAIRQASSDTTAGRARAQLSAAFVRLMQEGIADANPCIGTRGQAERSERDRVLNADELRAVWRACDDTDFGKIVRLLILTGCRREEIGGLMWSEVDLDAGTIKLAEGAHQERMRPYAHATEDGGGYSRLGAANGRPRLPVRRAINRLSVVASTEGPLQGWRQRAVEAPRSAPHSGNRHGRA